MLFIHKDVRTDPRFPLSSPELERIFMHLAEVFGLEACSVGLKIVDDQAMAQVHSQFMGCCGPTNILSFPAAEDTHLGDMILSADTLSREAFLYNQDTCVYTVRLLAHGLLHLMGYDHGPAMDALTEQAVETFTQVSGADPDRLFATL
ncbi:rRNA maturation RNase YbeY [Desulfovibrionales bacterium]